MPRLTLTIGLVLLSLGTALNWKSSTRFGDDFPTVYVIAKSIVQGVSIYTTPDFSFTYQTLVGHQLPVPHGLFYTPSSGIGILPLALLPVELASVIWFALSCVLMVLGFGLLIRLFAPTVPFGYQVLFTGLLMCSAVARWGFYALQAAPLVFGLLGLYLAALHRNHRLGAFATASVALSLKFTLGLPFIGIALLQRRYLFAAGLAGVLLAVNAIGFARLGGVDALHGYQVHMERFEQADEVNYPDYRAPTSMQRLDWPYLINAVDDANFNESNTLGIVLTLIAGAILLWQWLRTRQLHRDVATTGAFLGPLICLSLLSIYHHHYDAIALFGPVVVYLAQPRYYDRRLVAAFVVPILVFAGIYEVGLVQNVIEHEFGPGSSAVIKLLGVSCVITAFVASMLLLNGFVSRRRSAVRRAHTGTAGSSWIRPAANRPCDLVTENSQSVRLTKSGV